jgi:hypothetical protein
MQHPRRSPPKRGACPSPSLPPPRRQARLVGLTAAQELGIPWPEMEARLDALASLMPDIGSRLATLRPQLVAPLVRDLEQLPGAAGGLSCSLSARRALSAEALQALQRGREGELPVAPAGAG